MTKSNSKLITRCRYINETEDAMLRNLIDSVSLKSSGVNHLYFPATVDMSSAPIKQGPSHIAVQNDRHMEHGALT